MRVRSSKRARRDSTGSDLSLPAGYYAQKFVRHRDNGGIGLAVTDLGVGWSFSLNAVPDFAEFTTLFDAYIIDQVDIHFVLDNNKAEQYPTLLIAPDYDDANAPATENEVLTHQGCKILPFSPNKREHTFSVKPRVAMAVYRTGVTSSYGWSRPGQLMDIATTDTPWYGMKSWLVNYNSTDTAGARVRVYQTYHLRCVGQR